MSNILNWRTLSAILFGTILALLFVILEPSNANSIADLKEKSADTSEHSAAEVVDRLEELEWRLVMIEAPTTLSQAGFATFLEALYFMEEQRFEDAADRKEVDLIETNRSYAGQNVCLVTNVASDEKELIERYLIKLTSVRFLNTSHIGFGALHELEAIKGCDLVLSLRSSQPSPNHSIFIDGGYAANFACEGWGVSMPSLFRWQDIPSLKRELFTIC